jgi:Pyruvate/2-oxoacid:ferredoxin oxidoreductase gamma subunit
LRSQRSDVIVKKVDATKKASQFGKVLLANMIILGALVNLINLASKETIINALRESVPEKNLNEDLQAMEAGLEDRRD